MTIKASGGSLLILTTGFFVGFAAPSPVAANPDDFAVTDPAKPEAESDASEPVAVKKHVRHSSRHTKKEAHRKSGNVAEKSSTDSKTGRTELTAADLGISTAMPPTVANANAQLPSTDAPANTPAGNARAMSSRANDILVAAADQPPAQPDIQAAPQPATAAPAPADQVTDGDRSLQVGVPAASPPQATAETETPVATATARSNENSPTDKASLVGKIFIGFGALLTMASAARMLIG
jgi:hypothetical protein